MNDLQKLFSLTDRVAIITGGMGKLGTEYTKTLIAAGARVAIFDVVADPNSELKSLAKQSPLIFFKVDIRDETVVAKAVEKVIDHWETPTILINNAGWKASPNAPSPASVPFDEYPMAVWQEVFDSNTLGAAICAKVVGHHLIAQGKRGVIINIGSTYGLVSPDPRLYDHKKTPSGKPFIKDAVYGASKAALLALTRDLAVQWAPHGIRVVALSPGGVENPQGDPELTKKYSQRTPLGRMARVDEYNGAILFLASEASSYMTGTNLIVDGGWTIW